MDGEVLRIGMVGVVGVSARSARVESRVVVEHPQLSPANVFGCNSPLKRGRAYLGGGEDSACQGHFEVPKESCWTVQVLWEREER